MNTPKPTPKEVLVRIAKSYEGVHEEGGDNLGAQIVQFQKAIDRVASREPWCICFLQFCGLAAQKETGRRWMMFPTESALVMWEKSPALLRRSTPATGLIAIWQVGTTRSGHGDLVTKVDPGGRSFETIGGNTSPGPRLERDGDGVYSKILQWPPRRGSMRLLGFLEPFA